VPAHSPGSPEISPAEHRAALAEAELRAAEFEIEALRSRLERLTALLLETRDQRDATEYWLEQHRRSLSWTITGPLRAAKRVAARNRVR